MAESQLTLRHTYPDSDGAVHFMAFPPPLKVIVLPPNAVPLDAVLSELFVIFLANPLAEPPHMRTLYRLPMLAGNSSTGLSGAGPHISAYGRTDVVVRFITTRDS